MDALHLGLAWLAAGSVVAVLVTAVGTAAGPLPSYRVLDVVLLAQVAATGTAALAGVAVWLTAAPPQDPLHLLYGAVAFAAPMAVRLAVQGRDPRAVGRWVALAALVALGSTIRSFMTGS